MSFKSVATWGFVGILVAGLAAGKWIADRANPLAAARDSRSEIVFWHFWGGLDRAVVDDVVHRFNQSQDRYRVRAIAMPGNNLQAKLFLATAGGDPPDLVNQDDPVVGDWADRGIIQSIEAIASRRDMDEILQHLFPAARKLGTRRGELFALCNGLDVRALYFNRTALRLHGLSEPRSTGDLDQIAVTICPPGDPGHQRETFGYLPDFRRLWAWGYVFGGLFQSDAGGALTLNDAAIVAAANWMQQYARWYGPDTINRFRAGDQTLPGKAFPLLPVTDQSMTGRYVVIMDGQWRTRDIRAFLDRRRSLGIEAPEFGVCPLPPPPGGRTDAGWINGNFFVVPRGCDNPAGAMAFMKFWIGLASPGEAAQTCADGGWIPVSQAVVEHPIFQEFLTREPMFREFVRLAASPNQFPVPVIRGGSRLKRSVEQAAAEIMNRPDISAEAILRETSQRLNRLETAGRKR